MYNGQHLTAAQLAIVKSELQNDPESLGFAAYLSVTDWSNMAVVLDSVRDGVTPCSANGVIGPHGTITAATNATPIVITTATAHGRTTGDNILIANVGGNTAANGLWDITVVTSTTFSLGGSVGSAAYTSGGTWNWCIDNVRQGALPAIQVLGAIAFSDLITNGLSTQPTADQFGKFSIVMALCNQSSGLIQLTNPDGSDNNNAKTLKQIVGTGTASHAALIALETRLGSRAEQILSLSAPTPGQLLTWADAYAAINGSYPAGW